MTDHPEYTPCSPEETQDRISICSKCEKFAFRDNQVTYCTETELDIALMISVNELSCPLGKW